MFGLGGTTSTYKNTTSGLYKYQSIPAEIDGADDEHDNVADDASRQPRKFRTPLQNCVMFSLPLLLIVLITWALVSVSSTGREAQIRKSFGAGKGHKNNDNNVPNNYDPLKNSNKGNSTGTEDCVSCPAKILANDCSSKSSSVLGGLDFVDFYQNTEEGANGKVYREGSTSIISYYKGYRFQFLSVENQQLFQASPEQYLPQFGGFCTWGVTGEFCPTYAWSATCLGPSGTWSLGYKYKGKLYFFYESGAVSKFYENPDYYIEQGHGRWVSWYGKEQTVLNTNCFVKP